MNDKTERLKPPTKISGMAFDNIRPLASIKPVDPFKRPIFSNPGPVGQKPKASGATPSAEAPSKEKP